MSVYITIYTFEYGGYHFTPIRQFVKSEDDFFVISKRLAIDPDLGFSKYGNQQKFPYSYEDFYEATPFKLCDIFRCEENGKYYVPGTNELFLYEI